jgi:hypothetical protein
MKDKKINGRLYGTLRDFWETHHCICTRYSMLNKIAMAMGHLRR